MKYEKIIILILSLLFTHASFATVGPILGGGSMCAGSAITLTDASFGGIWISSNPAVATIDTTGSVYAISAGSTTISYVIGTTPGDTATTTIIVNPLPAGFSIGGGGSYCSGGSGANIYLAGSYVGISYQLFLGATPVGALIMGTGSVLSFGSMTMAGVYTILGVDAVTGCTSTMPGSATVSVNPNVIPSLTVSASPGDTVCAGASVTYAAIPVNGGTLPVYQWKVNDTIVASGSTMTMIPQDGAVVKAIMTSNATCALPDTATSALTMHVNPLPVISGGTAPVCTGSATTLSSSIPGGTWISSNPAIATINPATGAVSAVTSGTATIIYTTGTGCISTRVITINPLPASIIGISNVCTGLTATLIDITPGGSWSSSVPSVAGIGASTGIITGILSGSTTISYTVGSCAATHVVTVQASPSAISGIGSLCVGTTSVFTNATPGGTWSSASLAIATIGPASGIVTAVSVGLTTISYSTGSGCFVTRTITSNATPSAISGTSAICTGLSSTFINFTPGGLWTSSNSTIADIGSTSGIATGIAAGTTTISYITSAGCLALKSITINPSPGVISGPSSLCTSSTITLTIGSAGGTWSSSAPGTATVSPSGIVTAGASAGTTAISYTTGAGCSATYALTINALPAAYATSGGGNYCFGSAVPSIGLSASGSGINYQLFNSGIAVGSVIAGTGSALDFGPQTGAGTYTIIATNSITSCSRNMLGSPTITVFSQPASFSVMGGGSLCAGGSGTPIMLNSSEPGVSYQAFIGSIPAGYPVAGTGTLLNLGNFTGAGTYSVKATNSTTGCSKNMTGTAVIIVNPAPVAFFVTGGGGYCAGTAGAHVNLSGSQAGICYKLFRAGAFTGLVLYGNGASLDFGAQSAAGNYTINATDTATGCTSNMTGSVTVVINPLPTVFTVTGGGNYCSGGTGVHIYLSLTETGVNYQLYRGIAAIGSLIPGTNTPIDFGVETTPGSYNVVAVNATTSCTNNMVGSGDIVVNTLPNVFYVTGGGSFCSGGLGVSVGISGSTLGITYQLYNGTTTAGAPIIGTGGVLDFGHQTIPGTYTVIATNAATTCTSNMSATAVISYLSSVTPSVSMNITPGDTICTGTTVSYYATPVNGGITPTYQWHVNGVNTGTDSSYSYIPSNGDIVSVYMTSSAACAVPAVVNAANTMSVITVPAISGTAVICVGGSTSLSDALIGGIWTTTNPGVANIYTVGGSTGVVNGLAPGTTTIRYSNSIGCFSEVIITVNAIPAITANATAAACGGTTNLSAGGGVTYTWAPSAGLSCTTCALTFADPMATTTYTVTGYNAAGCSASAGVLVNGNRISGYISYSGSVTDVLKVWLIGFNPADSSLTAIDSTLTCMDSATPYYEFTAKPAGSYMVKAKLEGTIPGTSGYIPTYSLNTPYWYNAASVTHNAGTDTLHVNMIYGIVPPGPGFIGGLISSGAGKGTSGDAPARGMLVYLIDALSNNIMTYTYTDNAGAYSFNNIAYGNYLIYPESFSFTTIPSNVVMLSSSLDSAIGINFRQYNTSRVIKPLLPSNISTVTANTENLVTVGPNPSSGQINLHWGSDAKGITSVQITDLSGKQILTNSLNIDALKSINPTSPISTINLETLISGIYFLTIRSENINYCIKVILQK